VSIALVTPLLLLLAGATAAQPSPQAQEATGIPRSIEISPVSPGEAHRLHLRPELLSTLLFSKRLKLARMDLEKREHFARVTMLPDALMLLPSRAFVLGEELRLRVHFEDGTVPASADFILVVQSERTEQQVNVDLSLRREDSCTSEVDAQRAEARQCQAALTALQQEPEGLIRLLAHGQMNEQGVLALMLKHDQHFEELLPIRYATSYRAKNLVAVELWVTNLSGQDWTAAGAELAGADGVQLKGLRFWPRGPIHPSPEHQRVVVEAEATDEQARGSFTLQLWEEGKVPSITLPGVVFPRATPRP
jgi:uncharacterized protein (TIGR02268 family)